MKHLEVAVAVVFRDSKILIARRKAGGVLGGFWEFPGGKRESGESLEDCVRRELMEELAMRVQPVVSFAPIQHQYPDRHVTLHPFLCTHESGEPQLLACDEICWIEPKQLRDFSFPPANHQLIEQIITAFPAGKPNMRASKPKTASREPAAV
jgi:8-oxo-dGTP diphosphatase